MGIHIQVWVKLIRLMYVAMTPSFLNHFRSLETIKRVVMGFKPEEGLAGGVNSAWIDRKHTIARLEWKYPL